jgi:hypothetical protein
MHSAGVGTEFIFGRVVKRANVSIVSSVRYDFASC